MDIENYGIFDKKKFIFPDRNLILMYGPNETGKTTFLNCIRESFFGFKRINPYQFSDKPLVSELSLTLNDKSEIHYRRTKSLKTPVIGEGKWD